MRGINGMIDFCSLRTLAKRIPPTLQYHRSITDINKDLWWFTWSTCFTWLPWIPLICQLLNYIFMLSLSGALVLSILHPTLDFPLFHELACVHFFVYLTHSHCGHALAFPCLFTGRVSHHTLSAESCLPISVLLILLHIEKERSLEPACGGSKVHYILQ